ncbi:MAG TPA: hypothetical protein VHZ52_09225 [Acidobacteriaceae bacterium]|jgi:hypothetical protein|nr:hypothetical protein [Acidobacteriaceae bacterium]
MMSLIIAGIRILSEIPIALNANWTFRITRIDAPSAYLRATRTAMLWLTVTPVWLISASLFFCFWPRRLALAHLAVLAIFGMILVELSLHRFHKLPFTCSYMPGKGNLQFVFWAFALIFLPLINAAARFELRILDRPVGLCTTLALLAAVLAGIRRYNAISINSLSEIQFDEAVTPEIIGLNLDHS